MESNILLVDDNPDMIQVLARILSGLGQLRFASDGAAALRQARDFPPDLMLLEAEMPGMSGYQVCEAMKADPELRDVPVMFITAQSEVEFELKRLDIGAVDFVVKPISEPLLMARVKIQLRVKHLTDELKRIATIDALTGMLNRRSFEDALTREWARGLRAGNPISLLMIDVDDFKLFNDCYGPPTGDACLSSVALAVRSVCERPADVASRYGGEEFALLLPQTPRAGAEHVALRVLAAVQSLGFPHEASPTARHVTVSIGIGSYDTASTCWIDPSPDSRLGRVRPCTASDLLQSADTALYCAKRGGRDQAWRLDIDNVDAPEQACEIVAPSRAGRQAAFA